MSQIQQANFCLAEKKLHLTRETLIMSQFTQSLAVPGKKQEEALALAYGTFLQLGWTPEYAYEYRLTGYTKKTWDVADDTITTDYSKESVLVKSELNSSSRDVGGKNVKNIDLFVTAFENVKNTATTKQLNEWKGAMRSLAFATREMVRQADRDEDEVEKVMHLSSNPPVITYGIMVINVLVFIVMVIAGVGLFEPSESLVHWGGNYKPYTVNGDWWRLISCVFVHAGIVHVAFNLYALYMVGIFLEPMLGKTRYIAAYLSTGVLASVASLWWHTDPVVSIGASGAIFGLYGVFLPLLFSKLIPEQIRKSLLQSIGIFVLFNLVYGFTKPGIDNSAHIGGLLSGMVIGYAYLASLRGSSIRPMTVAMVVVIATVVGSGLYLTNASNDSMTYLKNLDLFHEMQDKALGPMSDEKITREERVKKVKEISLPALEASRTYLVQSASLKLNEKQSRQRTLWLQYMNLRIREANEMIQGESIEESEAEIKEVMKGLDEE
jgi:rhomboid protease GluP